MKNLNNRVALSVVGRYFKLRGSDSTRPRDTDFITEVKAGLTVFLALAYIVGLNAAVMAESGGPCVCSQATGSDVQCKVDVSYLACKEEFRKDVAVTTSIVTGIGSVLMGALANLPIELSCGMGTTVYFVYNMVGYHGSGGIPFHVALSAVFLEGIVFVLLTLLGVRQWVVRLVPATIKHATSVGVGLFICFVGMREDTGIGLIGPNTTTLVSLSGCTEENRDPVTQQCLQGIMQSPKTVLGMVGLVAMVVMSMFRVRGAILLSIFGISIASWIRQTQFTYFPSTPLGDAAFSYFSRVFDIHPITNTLGILSFDFSNWRVPIALLTMMYVDLINSTGVIFTQASMMDMVDADGDFERATLAFLCDGVTTAVGSLFGVPPVTAHFDSSIGIAEGGRTGIVAIVAGILFLLLALLTPIFTSFPPWATGPSLIMIGVMMARPASMVPWEYPGEAVPAFLTIATIPLSFSVPYGILAGILSYTSIHILSRLIAFATRGSLVPLIPPDDYDLESNRRKLTFLPPWITALKAWFDKHLLW
ncbi:hypothetical protein DSO57_1027389 [Entomophthora muscae]|uniref:Uncharacterized protein n=1 Tax=Entomophthora muscae TaxID=34485 RepID=A0ACC2RSQ9_9FUNG|nr:hypothetical protein DSO57_1027389 [Entomophthora muscae]